MLIEIVNLLEAMCFQCLRCLPYIDVDVNARMKTDGRTLTFCQLLLCQLLCQLLILIFLCTSICFWSYGNWLRSGLPRNEQLRLRLRLRGMRLLRDTLYFSWRHRGESWHRHDSPRFRHEFVTTRHESDGGFFLYPLFFVWYSRQSNRIPFVVMPYCTT